MQLSDNDSPTEDFEDGDTIVMNRPTVENYLEKFKELKRKYVDLELANIILQAKLKASEDVESSDKTSTPEESQSGAESDEVESEIKKPGSTRISKIIAELQRLKKMTPSKQNQYISHRAGDVTSPAWLAYSLQLVFFSFILELISAVAYPIADIFFTDTRVMTQGCQRAS
jgi:hypothetical protein